MRVACTLQLSSMCRLLQLGTTHLSFSHTWHWYYCSKSGEYVIPVRDR